MSGRGLAMMLALAAVLGGTGVAQAQEQSQDTAAAPLPPTAALTLPDRLPDGT